MSRLILITALFAAFALCVNAQDTETLKKQIKEYAELNIHPHMKLWKSKIDNELDKDVLQKLNNMRAEAAELKQQGFEMMKNFSSEKEKSKERPRQTEHRAKFKEFHVELSKIIEQHSKFFNELNDEIKPLAQKWREDIQKLKMDWKQSNNPTDNCEYKGENCDGKGKRSKMKHARKFMNNPQHELYRVMLWDGKSIDFGDSEIERINQSFGNMNTTVFPNPSTGAINFEFDAVERGTYEIVITDISGNIVKSEKINVIAPGKNSHSVNGLNLGNGVYTYTISNNEKLESGRVVVRR